MFRMYCILLTLQVIRFGFGESCDLRAENIRTSASGTNFEVLTNVRENFLQKYEFKLNLAGKYNVLNALGVITLARHNGISDRDIQELLIRSNVSVGGRNYWRSQRNSCL